MRTCLTCAGLLLLSTGPAGAETTVYDQDGVQVWTSLRLVTRNAATCRVLEDSHSEAEYAEMKANEGQPLHVWRLDLVASNYSGKVIDYLRASVGFESNWPPCTNWDWNQPTPQYPGPVEWTSSYLLLQRVAGMQPGEDARETGYLLVFHGEEPAFGRWSVDYDFAEGAATATDATGAERPAVAGGHTPDPGTPGRIEPEPTCAGKEVGVERWMETENQPGCYLWNPNLQREVRVTWTGDCADGLANGAGEWTLTWNVTWDGGTRTTSSTGTGELRNGKMNGHWTERSARGSVNEGSYVDGKMNGRWTTRWSDGNVRRSLYRDCERIGDC